MKVVSYIHILVHAAFSCMSRKWALSALTLCKPQSKDTHLYRVLMGVYQENVKHKEVGRSQQRVCMRSLFWSAFALFVRHIAGSTTFLWIPEDWYRDGGYGFSETHLQDVSFTKIQSSRLIYRIGLLAVQTSLVPSGALITLLTQTISSNVSFLLPIHFSILNPSLF